MDSKSASVWHSKKVFQIQESIRQYLNTKDTRKIIFDHGSSNSTRYENDDKIYRVDLSGLDNILDIDTERKVVIVEPNVPMDKLLAFTLKYDLMPPVVPEFPGITVGGAIQGGSGESASFKYGEFHDSCFEYEMILGNGDTIIASAQQNTDLFQGTDSSYGSLGIMTKISISLIPSYKYVELTYYPTRSFSELVDSANALHKKKENWLDAIIFSKDRGVIMTGKGVNSHNGPQKRFMRSFDPWFGKHAGEISKKGKVYTEYIPITDYIFRYDRGAFWMGDYFFKYMHMPNTRLARWILNPMFDTRTLFLGLQKARLAKEFFIQDICFPIEHTKEFLEFLDNKLGIYPLWVCPLKPVRNGEFLCSHDQKTELVLNIGIWGRTEKYLKDPMGKNREVELFCDKYKARKVLYAHQYYDKSEFWDLYDKNKYDNLRKKYHATEMFTDVYSTTHVSEFTNKTPWAGLKAVVGHVLRKITNAV